MIVTMIAHSPNESPNFDLGDGGELSVIIWSTSISLLRCDDASYGKAGG